MAVADREWATKLTPDLVPVQYRRGQEDSTI